MRKSWLRCSAVIRSEGGRRYCRGGKKKKKEDYLIGVIFRIFLRRGRQALLHVMVDLGSEAIAGQYRFAGISGWSTVHVQPVAVDSQQPANCF